MEACSTPRPHLRMIDWPSPAFNVYWQLCLSEYDCERVQNSFSKNLKVPTLCTYPYFSVFTQNEKVYEVYSGDGCAWNQSCCKISTTMILQNRFPEEFTIRCPKKWLQKKWMLRHIWDKSTWFDWGRYHAFSRLGVFGAFSPWTPCTRPRWARIRTHLGLQKLSQANLA